MNYVLKKIYTFEAAHRLIKNYSGKCNNNHGHSYRVAIEIEATELDNRDMVIDFNETKILKQWIDDNLDHASILWKEDPLIPLLKQLNNKLFITEESPTSEYLAKIILEKSMEIFNSERVKVRSIEINETCTSGVTLYAKDF
ncbi:MAG: 6-carboxytetrahydropterin synthase [Bacteroidales bacterium]|nr:6-carboxytetrahydropterin synthase [Bacteroidales bacterium]